MSMKNGLISLILSVMKWKKCVFLSKNWKLRQIHQLGFWGYIKLPCDPTCHSSHCQNSPLNIHSCWSPLFELAAGGLKHRLALSYPASPPTLQFVTIAWRGLLRGLKPPTAAARLVNGSTYCRQITWELQG